MSNLAKRAFELYKKSDELSKEADNISDPQEQLDKMLEANDVESEIYPLFDKFSNADRDLYSDLITSYETSNGSVFDEIDNDSEGGLEAGVLYGVQDLGSIGGNSGIYI